MVSVTLPREQHTAWVSTKCQSTRESREEALRYSNIVKRVFNDNLCSKQSLNRKLLKAKVTDEIILSAITRTNMTPDVANELINKVFFHIDSVMLGDFFERYLQRANLSKGMQEQIAQLFFIKDIILTTDHLCLLIAHKGSLELLLKAVEKVKPNYKVMSCAINCGRFDCYSALFWNAHLTVSDKQKLSIEYDLAVQGYP